MADPFLAEIRIFAGNFAPRGWALCDGQILPISQNTALFSLLGTTYGGDGRSTFGLPNLQGSVPVGSGQAPGLSYYDLGEVGGATTVSVIPSEMPAHTHTAFGSTNVGSQVSPSGGIWAAPGAARGLAVYSASAGSSPAMSAAAFAPSGGSQPHNNMPPFLTLNFIIALQGIYPPRT